jgi:hypothetical protein
MKNSLVLFVTGFLLFGCSKEEFSQTVFLDVIVVDRAEQPVANSIVSIDGQRIGKTSALGQLRTPLGGPAGRVVQVKVECPGGLIPRREDIRTVPIRFFRPIEEKSKGWVPLKSRFKCVSKVSPSVLIVRADKQSNLPIEALGRNLSITDENGVAAAVIKGVPGDEIEIIIDTGSRPELKPTMPSRRLTIPANSQIFVFDQKFEKRSPPQKKAPKAKKRSGPRRIPHFR